MYERRIDQPTKQSVEKQQANTVAMLGCFDTKAEDFNYLYTSLQKQGLEIITINTGVLGSTDLFPITYDAASVAVRGGGDIQALREKKDRGTAIEITAKGAGMILNQLEAEGKIKGVIGMGGGGGTYIFLSAMQGLPFGLPKICLSTLATKDLSSQILNKDITLIPSIVDVAGLNKISRVLINQAAGALAGMINAGMPEEEAIKGTIAISIFGNTTACVDACSALLEAKGYEVMTFHAVGAGGRSMEALIRDKCFDGVLDITTTELADDLCGGICSAGPDRLTAAAETNIPQVVVPGCLDMVNFGGLDTVPERYKSRLLFSWAPDVTLMRTNEEENEQLGRSLATKVNQSKGKVKILLPLKGISIVSSAGEIFHQPNIDQLLFDTIKSSVNDEVEVIELETHINDTTFAERAVNELLAMLEAK